ncbi:MAG: thiamine diphosphokinase [Boseongicola sp.]|nr:thiamine diphosphokinase [Boseongicola sp.]MDD9976857.1 thiamine diphosphokinase [Boseongicola sp.]
MENERIQAASGVTLIGGGDPSITMLEEALTHAPMLVGADGGANFALKHGLTPDFAIGDFDSISADVREALPDERLIHDPDQDTTDFQKCLSRLDAPFILAVGFTGGRMDHTLAAMSALLAESVAPTVLLTEHDLVFAVPQEFSVDLGQQSRFSLYPMVDVTGTSEGLKWPIDGLSLAPNGRIATSNETTGPVKLSLDRRGMLGIVPRAQLGRIIPALVASWPARA